MAKSRNRLSARCGSRVALLVAVAVASVIGCTALPGGTTPTVSTPTIETGGAVTSGLITSVALSLDFTSPKGDPAVVVVEMLDDAGNVGAKHEIRLTGATGVSAGTLKLYGPVWVVRGAHTPNQIRVTLYDVRGNASAAKTVAFTVVAPDGGASQKPDIASTSQAIHDCPVIAGGVGAWAAGIGQGTWNTNWCGGGAWAEGTRGDPMNCWDECCRSHDYCFGRGVDGYETCHQRVGDITTDCIHDCDRALESCWTACNTTQSANAVTWGQQLGITNCADGAAPTWCAWYNEWTCNRTLTCTRPQPPPAVGRPSACCVGSAAECAACAGRDWGCGLNSNWNAPYTFTPSVPPVAGCGGECRGNPDCGDPTCGFCGARQTDGKRYCEARQCGYSCRRDPASGVNTQSCWGIRDADGGACELCVFAYADSVVGTCQARSDGLTNLLPGGIDAGVWDAGADAGSMPGADGGAGSDGGASTDAGYDAGAPVGDAGNQAYDAGDPQYDAGYPVYDAGTPYDGGWAWSDAGVFDAGP